MFYYTYFCIAALCVYGWFFTYTHIHLNPHLSLSLSFVHCKITQVNYFAFKGLKTGLTCNYCVGVVQQCARVLNN